MNLDLVQALILSGEISKAAENIKEVEVVLAPPSVFLYPINDYLKAKPNNLSLALQNMMWEPDGAYTGEISLPMVKGICKYVIIGHSERRRIFAETDETVGKKLSFALTKNIKPILCVGEMSRFHLEEYYDSEVAKMSKTGGILSQIDVAIKNISKDHLKDLIIAYEPVWAIGTGNNATGAYAAAIAYIIKNHLKVNLGEEISSNIRVLYGGSAEPDNVKEFMLQPSIDGLLVGGASLHGKQFIELVKTSSEVKSGRII
jgi:triosephosphate isomerase